MALGIGFGETVQQGAGRCGDPRHVGVGDLLERPLRGQRSGGIGQQLSERGDGTEPDVDVSTVQSVPQLFGERRSRDTRWATGQEDVTFGAIQPPLRRLLRRSRPELIEGILVGVVDRDEPIPVYVGGAAADAFDQGAGEYRTWHLRARHRLTLEGVFAPARGGQDDPSATTAMEPLPKPEIGVALRGVSERAAKATVQDHYLAPSAAVVELLQQPLRLDTGSGESILPRVGGREEQTVDGRRPSHDR